jgi:hypothetical protein
MSYRSQAIITLSSSYFVSQTQYSLSSTPSSSPSGSASPGTLFSEPGAEFAPGGIADVDLDREAKVDFFVELTAVNFLLLNGAADGPSEDVLGFVFVEPLGFTRLLGCG